MRIDRFFAHRVALPLYEGSYKERMALEGHREYALHLYESDRLSDSQQEYLHRQWQLFKRWCSEWPDANPS